MAIGTNFSNLNFAPQLECKGSIGGIIKVWVSDRNNWGNWYYSQTHKFQYQLITGNSIIPIVYELGTIMMPDTNYNEAWEEIPSRSYLQEFNVEFIPNDKQNRDGIEQLILNQYITLIFQDTLGRYFLTGETWGMRPKNNSYNTDKRLGNDIYSLSLRARERSPIRQIDPSLMEIIIDQSSLCPICCCGLSIDELNTATYPIQVLNNLSLICA